MKHNIVFIGLDTHKDFHEVAYVEEQRGAQVVHQGRINGSKVAIQKMVRQFESKYPHATLHLSPKKQVIKSKPTSAMQ